MMQEKGSNKEKGEKKNNIEENCHTRVAQPNDKEMLISNLPRPEHLYKYSDVQNGAQTIERIKA